MDVQLYLKDSNNSDYIQLDLFKDEKIEINLNVKNLSDISKIRSDFTQPFTIPTSPINNGVFQYWFDTDVDGTFNANIRIDAYIEVNSLPFRFGSVQLDNCKLKNGQPYSYSITFFGAGVNLSDKFGDDYLKDLNLSAYDHNYNSSVISSINDTSLSGGDVYYPLVNARTYMDYGSGSTYDLKFSSNTISYRDFKPALRELKIIEAIEHKYNVTFSRDFFDRSIFYNKFLWLHKEVGVMKTSSTALPVDITSKVTGIANWSISPDEIDLVNNSVRINWATGFVGSGYLQPSRAYSLVLNVYPLNASSYKVEVFDNNVLFETYDNLNGNVALTVYNKRYNEDAANHLFTFKVSSIDGFLSFNTATVLIAFNPGAGVPVYREINGIGTTQTTVDSILKIKEQLPDMKVKEYFTSLVNEFNLIIKPTGVDSYYIDTLDNWYSRGKAYDISNLVDIKDITVKRPSVKKRIEFLYQKTNTVLGKQYFDNNQVGYGDLKATYNITGDELKIESQFENLMFERLVDASTNIKTDLQVGFAVDLNGNAVKGKALSFYRNGIENGALNIGGSAYTEIWHTATEDNINFNQVTNSLNFGADNSSYFYAPIITGLYYNFWKTYIEDLYNKKTRVLSLKCKLPIRILLHLGLNDRFIIGDYKYKISTVRVDLTNGDADIEVFSDLSAPTDSVNSIIPITVDSTDITVDSELYTVDETSIHLPDTSYIINGISLTTYVATKGEEHFEVKISANTNWSLISSNSWIIPNKTSGNKSDYIRVKLLNNSGAARTGTITFTIGAATFMLTITQ